MLPAADFILKRVEDSTCSFLNSIRIGSKRPVLIGRWLAGLLVLSGVMESNSLPIHIFIYQTLPDSYMTSYVRPFAHFYAKKLTLNLHHACGNRSLVGKGSELQP